MARCVSLGAVLAAARAPADEKDGFFLGPSLFLWEEGCLYGLERPFGLLLVEFLRARGLACRR